MTVGDDPGPGRAIRVPMSGRETADDDPVHAAAPHRHADIGA